MGLQYFVFFAKHFSIMLSYKIPRGRVPVVGTQCRGRVLALVSRLDIPLNLEIVTVSG